ncbi:glutathione S-transferase L3-like isoform X1 [Papaver somniferum]|uniref:glutathione S-transferase L3-like isoform X1 n=1 Tax=Papaver somniferum TaxID=3469 RepID=UPI000E6FE1DB|nr:glutathione S-transferase L3-like isoform X1 [Papaver somniferum]
MAALNGNCYSISHGNVDKPFLLFSNNYSTSIRIPQKNTKSSSLSILFSPSLCLCRRSDKTRVTTAFASMATTTSNVQVEELPPALDSTSEPPSVFDGTTRLYISYMCPYAQRVWITRNCKGLQEKIKLVPIDLPNRPDWYKEKVYPANKVPALEHNNEVIGESLDLIKYLDTNFEGPALFPNDPAKREFAEELLSYTSEFSSGVVGSIKGDKDVGAPFDYLEAALSKFPDGPFFLGEFSLVDIAYAPFVERYQPLVLDVKKYDFTSGRPKLASWIEELNKIDGYRQTKRDPAELVASLKKRILGI